MNAASQTGHVHIIVVSGERWIGRPHFNGRVQRDQLQAEGLADVVDIAENVLTEAVAINYPGKGLQDSDPHATAMIRGLGTPQSSTTAKLFAASGGAELTRKRIM